MKQCSLNQEESVDEYSRTYCIIISVMLFNLLKLQITSPVEDTSYSKKRKTLPVEDTSYSNYKAKKYRLNQPG